MTIAVEVRGAPPENTSGVLARFVDIADSNRYLQTLPVVALPRLDHRQRQSNLGGVTPIVDQWTRYGGRGVMIYWYVEKKSVCIYSQLKRCSSSEVAAMIEGLLRHCT